MPNTTGLQYKSVSKNASYFSEPIEDTEELLVPVVCIYEVFKKVLIVADESRAFQVVAQMKQGEVIALTEEIAVRASMVSIRHKLPMADSFIYATAQAYEANIWTLDSDFKGLPGVNYKKK